MISTQGCLLTLTGKCQPEVLPFFFYRLSTGSAQNILLNISQIAVLPQQVIKTAESGSLTGVTFKKQIIAKRRRENFLTKHNYFQNHIITLYLLFFEVVIETYPYKGPSLPIAETMMTLLAVSSHTYKKIMFAMRLCHKKKRLF